MNEGTRARSWLLVAAAAWLLIPAIGVLEMRSPLSATLPEYAKVVPLVLVWGLWSSRDRRLRTAISTAAIAASSLVLAWLITPTALDLPRLLAVVIAIASVQSLQLLGGRDDPALGSSRSSFAGSCCSR